jgi:hypothetical protein
MALKFVPTGKTLDGKGYDLLLDGVRIGIATAKVTRAATGIHRLRGTTYHAYAFNQHFYGSRKGVARKVETAAQVTA